MRIFSLTISGSLTICSTVSRPTMPRRWPSITSRIIALAVLRRLAQELLGGGQDALAVRAHLELRHRLHLHRDALIGIEILLRRDIERHQLQREQLRFLHERDDQRAAARQDALATRAIDDQRLVWANLAIHAPIQVEDEQHRNHRKDDDQHHHDQRIHVSFPPQLPIYRHIQ